MTGQADGMAAASASPSRSEDDDPPTRVKICGLRDAGTIRAMDGLPVDEIGFVFAESRRKVTPELAGELIAEVRRLRTPAGTTPLAVGVFVNPDPERLREALAQAPLDVVQLHGEETPELCGAIRAELGVRVWKVVSVGEAASGTEAGHASGAAGEATVLGAAEETGQAQRHTQAAHTQRSAAAERHASSRSGPGRLLAYRGVVDAVMIDTSGGGTGRAFDWGAIGEYLAAAREIGVPLYVAGGLHPGNVGELLAVYAPGGVDVSSGVETDGIKDLDKIKAFVERVKRA